MTPEAQQMEKRSYPAKSGVRLAELMAALSIATDLGMGQPLETALSSCVVAIRLGEALNLDGDTMRDVYYQALLRYIGCNAETYALAALVGDGDGPRATARATLIDVIDVLAPIDERVAQV